MWKCQKISKKKDFKGWHSAPEVLLYNASTGVLPKLAILLLRPFWPTKSGQKATKTSQTLLNNKKSGWRLWLHQIWSTRWKNRGQKALYVYREIGINQGFCLQHCWDKYQPLISIKIPPKVYRLFRTCISPVGAFDCIKFGHPGGKIEVRMQFMSIANFA